MSTRRATGRHWLLSSLITDQFDHCLISLSADFCKSSRRLRTNCRRGAVCPAELIATFLLCFYELFQRAGARRFELVQCHLTLLIVRLKSGIKRGAELVGRLRHSGFRPLDQWLTHPLTDLWCPICSGSPDSAPQPSSRGGPHERYWHQKRA